MAPENLALRNCLVADLLALAKILTFPSTTTNCHPFGYFDFCIDWLKKMSPLLLDLSNSKIDKENIDAAWESVWDILTEQLPGKSRTLKLMLDHTVGSIIQDAKLNTEKGEEQITMAMNELSINQVS
jgi:hypothetical protein